MAANSCKLRSPFSTIRIPPLMNFDILRVPEFGSLDVIAKAGDRSEFHSFIKVVAKIVRRHMSTGRQQERSAKG